MTLVVEPATWLGRFSPRLWALANGVRLAVETRLLRGGAIGHGPRGLPRVALTFDDGPDPRWTPGILDHLERAGARATFFFTGMNVAEHPELAREVASRHQVGTHLFSHHRGLTRDRRFFLDDMERAREVHERVLGRRPGALRFPFGDSGRIRAVELRRYGLVPYHWSFSTLDSRAETPVRIVERFSSLVGPGDIVLLHDGRSPGSSLGPGHRRNTVAALPEILDVLARRGLKAVTLDELFSMRVDRDADSE